MDSLKQGDGARILAESLKLVGGDDSTRIGTVDSKCLGRSIQLPKGGTEESGKNR